MTHEYKGKEYEVQEGKRGGKFFIDDSGKKHYLKNDTPKPKKEEVIKPASPTVKKRYTAWFNVRNSDGEIEDDFKEWTDAYSKQEALDYFRHDYPDTQRYEIDIFKIENINED